MSGCCDPNDERVDPWRAGAWSTAACAVAVLAGWALQAGGYPVVALAAFVGAYLAGGWETALRTARALRRGDIDVDLLMLLAAVGAALVGHWLEGAALLFLFSLGNTLETYAFGRTRRSIRSLMELRPEVATRVVNGDTAVVPLDELIEGDLVRVRPGERIPVDGMVVEGASHVDESTLTGESRPVRKDIESSVFAGTLNGSGSLDVRMTRAADDTALARVIRLVEDAREQRAPTQSWIEEVEGRYAVGVIAASAIAVFVFWLGLGWAFDDAFYRAMTLLVVASPCALVISIPATIVSAVSNGARHGVLFKGGAHLDALADVRAFAFDKTGTLTVGRPTLERLVIRSLAVTPAVSGTGADALDDELEVLRLVAAAEARSEHHLATAIAEAAEARGIDVPEPDSFDSFAGQGVSATVAGVRVEVGRRRWILDRTREEDPEDLDAAFGAAHAAGATPVYASLDGRVVAALSVADAPRADVADSLQRVRREGITHLAMLTGDHEETARTIGAAVGVDEVHAELLPDGKTAALEEIRARHGSVAMVGDGVNDAPALAVADVGIALGGAGTDVALETADIVVMGEDLGGLAHAIRLSRRARRIVRQNLAFSVGMMVVLVALALSGNIGLTVGVIGHEGSTIVVVFNGLRLLVDERAR